MIYYIMIDTQYMQELLNCEILLNNFEITYTRRGSIFDLKLCNLFYRGPQIGWFVRGQYFKLKSIRTMYILHSLSILCKAYERYLLLKSIPELLSDTVNYEIMPYLLL